VPYIVISQEPPQFSSKVFNRWLCLSKDGGLGDRSEAWVFKTKAEAIRARDHLHANLERPAQVKFFVIKVTRTATPEENVALESLRGKTRPPRLLGTITRSLRVAPVGFRALFLP
jgi:hypothetical protein